MEKIKQQVVNCAVPMYSSCMLGHYSGSHLVGGSLYDACLAVFAGMYASDRFTAAAAHKAFAGLKRSK